MTSTQFRAEIKVIFRTQLDDDVGIRLQEFYLCDETSERELLAGGVICSIYDRNCLAVRIEQEDEAMESEPHAALRLFEEVVLEEVGSLIRFSKANKYRIRELRAKIYSGNQLLLAGGRASAGERITNRLKGPSVLAKLTGLISAILTGVLLGADKGGTLIVIFTASVGIIVAAVIEALYENELRFSKRP